MQIKPYEAVHLDALIGLTLRAWEPVFASIEQVIDADVYEAFYPQQWQVSQQKAVVDVCGAADTHVWVAFEADAVVGFVVVKLHGDDKMGEIEMVGVDPDFQGRGIGAGLIAFAVDWMREAGMSIAMVETGGDPGHGSARRAYEQAGFGLWPVARYFKKL
jgi:GNAT superfamily N-acetyltransferase